MSIINTIEWKDNWRGIEGPYSKKDEKFLWYIECPVKCI